MPLDNPPQPTPHPNLIVSRLEAKTKIEGQLQKGPGIRNLEIYSENDLNQAKAQETKWRNVNIILLRTIFSNSFYADQYAESTMPSRIVCKEEPSQRGSSLLKKAKVEAVAENPMANRERTW